MKQFNKLKSIILFTFLISITFNCYAVDKYFIASNGQWSIASNWSPSGVPTANDMVFIAGNGLCTLNIDGYCQGIQLIIGDFVIDPGIKLTIEGTPAIYRSIDISNHPNVNSFTNNGEVIFSGAFGNNLIRNSGTFLNNNGSSILATNASTLNSFYSAIENN